MWRYRDFCRDENGATAIEYAMIAAFIALAIIAGVTSVGTTVSTIFTSVSAGFSPAP